MLKMVKFMWYVFYHDFKKKWKVSVTVDFLQFPLPYSGTAAPDVDNCSYQTGLPTSISLEVGPQLPSILPCIHRALHIPKTALNLYFSLAYKPSSYPLNSRSSTTPQPSVQNLINLSNLLIYRFPKGGRPSLACSASSPGRYLLMLFSYLGHLPFAHHISSLFQSPVLGPLLPRDIFWPL